MHFARHRGATGDHVMVQSCAEHIRQMRTSMTVCQFMALSMVAWRRWMGDGEIKQRGLKLSGNPRCPAVVRGKFWNSALKQSLMDGRIE